MTRRIRPLALAVLLAFAGPSAALAQHVRYDDHKLVNVTLNTARDIDTMLAISEDHWSDAIGIGVAPFRVPPDQMPALSASGLHFEILNNNIQTLIDAEQAALMRRGGAWFDTYHDYAAVNAYMDTLIALRPDLAVRISTADSLEGRAIDGLRITGTNGPAGKPAALFNSCQHAREWVSVATTMYIADHLVRNYDSDPRIHALLDQAVVYVIPIINPDGYQFTWTTDRLWRKNRRDNGDGTFGVDTNRNWGVAWGGSGSSGSTSSQTYRGPAAFSEPETRALRDFVLAHPEIKTHIDFHSYSQLILSPFGYTNNLPPEPDRTTFDNLNAAMQQAIFDVHGLTYTAGPTAPTLYLASGNAVDWVYEGAGTLSWTIELRPASSNPGFILPPDQIRPTAEENFEAALLLVDYATQLLTFDYPAGLPDRLDAGVPTDVDVRIIEVNGALAPGSATLYWRVGASGAFTPSSLAPNAARFVATLPATDCGQVLQYYFAAQTTDGLAVSDPPDAPASVYSADALETTTLLTDDMEADTGWIVGSPADTATTGIWNRMDPEPTNAQPGDDHSPAGTVCWVTDGLAGAGIGSFDVDGGATTLTSPLLDLSAAVDPHIGYWRWYSNNQGSAPGADVFTVDISTDGINWVNVETVGPAGPDTIGGWIFHEFRASDFAPAASSVRLRFIASDFAGGSIVEAAVDDLAVRDVGCADAPCLGDLNGDGSRDLADLAILLGNFGTPSGAAPEDGDLTGDGDVDLEDLSILLAAFGSACP